jgi:hypothetical protein
MVFAPGVATPVSVPVFALAHPLYVVDDTLAVIAASFSVAVGDASTPSASHAMKETEIAGVETVEFSDGPTNDGNVGAARSAPVTVSVVVSA